MSNSVNLSLDVTKTEIQNPLIKVRQGDGGFETLRTTVTSNGEPLDLQGWTITFMGTTAGDHKIVDGNVTLVEAPNGIFDYTPSKAWGMDIGEFKIAYFKFVKGDGSASSANFRVSVIEAVDLTQAEAQNYISVADTTIAEVREHLESSLADVTQSIAATSSAAGSLSVQVSSAVNQVNSVASSAVNNVDSVASSAASYIAINDAQLVHKAGTETITGNKTFAGLETFNQPIVGATFIAPVPSGVTSIVSLVSNAIAKYGSSGQWFNIAYIAYNQSLTDAPDVNETYYKIVITSRGQARTYVSMFDLSGRIFNATVSNGVLSTWGQSSQGPQGVPGQPGNNALPVAGVYPNLSALSNANPNHNNVYITTDNGNWNYWNGTAWVAGGVYQSTGIADGSITTPKLTPLNKSSFIYNELTSGVNAINIDKDAKTLSIKGRYLNYDNKSVALPSVVIDLNAYQHNVIYYNPVTNTLGAKDGIQSLTESDIYLGIVDRNFDVIDLKVTQYNINGVNVRPIVTDKMLDRHVYYLGDAMLNLDNATAYFTGGWLNFDFGGGRGTTATSIDVTNNKIIYFDLLDNLIKATDNYNKITDSQIFLGYFDANSPKSSFFANFSRVLIIKNGITYAADEYKASGIVLSNVYMATFGDSITSDQVSGTGTLIMNALGAKKTGNFATGWSTGSDWHNGATNTTTVTLTTPNNTDTNDNVLSNQVRRALQYTTASGAQITWTHPIDGTFSLDTALGTGLGNTDKVPTVIYIAISTNDGKNANVPIVDDTDVVFAQSYKDLTRNSLASGLRWAIETLQSAYPNAKIFVASPIQTANTVGHMSFTNTKLKRDIVEKVAQFTSVYFVDSFAESGFSRLKNKTWTDDGVHPSTIGKPKLVDYVTNEIRKNV